MNILVISHGSPATAELEALGRAILGARLERWVTVDRLGSDPAWLRDAPFDVVFVESPDCFTVQERARGRLDFILKPLRRERLAEFLGHGSGVIGVRRHGRIDLLPLDEVVYAEGAEKYSELVLADGRRSFCDQSLARLEEWLPGSFVRIHKSYLVRFSSIAHLLVQQGSRYYAVLQRGQRLPVGRSRYRRIKQML